jgi:serine protease Do
MKGWQIFGLGAAFAAALVFAVLPGYATPQDSQGRYSSRTPQQMPMPNFEQAPGMPFGDFSWLDDRLSLQDGEAEPGWLGVAIEDISADKAKELKLPAARGVLIQNVDPNGPAAKAGLKAGDVITDFNGQQLQGTAQFRREVRETPPGRNVPIIYWRDGKSQTMSVELASRRPSRSRIADGMPAMPMIPRELPGNFMVPRTPTLGIAAMDVSGQLGAYFSVPDGEGVLVTEVKENSPAAKGGLKAGDVITEVNAKRVHDLGELRAQLGEDRDAKPVSLTVIRKGAKTSVSVEPEAPKPAQPRSQHMAGRHT